MPRLRPLPFVAAALLAACATSGRVVTVESRGEVAPPAAPVVVRVRSDFAGPLTIYTVNEGVATRLGELPGARVEEFRLTATQLPTSGITLLAVPRTGDARATSAPLRATPGAVLEFTIGRALTDASAAIRSP